jgi:hypothetical protein
MKTLFDADGNDGQTNEVEKIKALDELFLSSARYRNSQDYFDLLKFINKFPKLSPFNAFLIHMQNNGVEIVMTAEKWKKYRRQIKFNARPLVILIPFGPVQFVYDIADTEGDEIPESLINPFYTHGTLSYGIFHKTVKNSLKESIQYQEEVMHINAAGFATTLKNGEFMVKVNSTYPINVKYSTLVHELGHIFSGHLGKTKNSWWEQRPTLPVISKEIEAESISYLVCNRIGLKTTSETYLSNYIRDHASIPPISLDTILTVSNYIEQMSRLGFKTKARK